MTEPQGGSTRPTAQRIAGRYEVLGRLGSGPHGPTYRALDHRQIDASDLEREVALKILRTPAAEVPDFDARLDALVSGLAELDDAVLVTPLDAGRTELGLPYLTFEVVRGTSLEDVLATEGALPPEEARALVLRLAEALQAVHDRGLVHGALDTHQVILAGSERQPRLMDVGLSTLVAEDRRTVERDDVRALGRLLAVLVTGDATGGTSPEDPELRPIVEQALAEDGFQEASAIAAALSVTPDATDLAREQPQETPVLVRPGPSRKPLVFMMLFLAVAAAFTAWHVRGNVIAAREKEALAREEGERARLAQELREEAARGEELARELEAARAELVESEGNPPLAEKLNELSEELEATREETESLREEKDAAERTLAEAERERAEETARRTALQTERDQVQGELEELQRREEERRRKADADTLFAQDLAARVADGDPRAVGFWLRSPGAQEELAGDMTGSSFLDAWTRADDLLERSATASTVQIGPLIERATDVLAEARSHQAGFVTQLRSALGKQPSLESALDDALTTLEDRVEERIAARDTALQWEWNALLEAPLETAPDAALQLAATFEDERQGQLLRAVAETLDGLYAPDGELDLAALRAGPSLAPWAEALGDERSALMLPAANAVLRHAWAQVWFAPTHATDDPWSWPLPDREGESAVARALRLELELFRPQGPYPGPPGRQRLYRTSTADGRTSWQIETIQPDDGLPPGERGSWRVLQRFYDSAGRYKSERTLRITREGRAFVEEGVRQRILFGARSKPRATARWSPPIETPPSRLPITPDAIAAFQERLARTPVDVLVDEAGTTTSLWAPAFGLVHHEDPGLVTRELCYAD